MKEAELLKLEEALHAALKNAEVCTDACYATRNTTEQHIAALNAFLDAKRTLRAAREAYDAAKKLPEPKRKNPVKAPAVARSQKTRPYTQTRRAPCSST